MKQLLIGTNNPAKAKRFREMLLHIPSLEISYPKKYGIDSAPDEPYADVAQNALHKARYYAKMTGMSTLANDSGLVLDFLSSREQPGACVRRSIGSDSTSDREMHEYYLTMFQAQAVDVLLTGAWTHGFAFVTVDGTEHIFTAKRSCIFLREPIGEYQKGYPLSNLCMDADSGKTWVDTALEERKSIDRRCFTDVLNFIEKYYNFG